LTKPTTMNGRSVVGISGGLGQGFSGSPFTGSETLYVSTSAPYLPVEVVDQLTANGKSGTETDIFSDWGESVTVTVTQQRRACLLDRRADPIMRVLGPRRCRVPSDTG